MVKIDIPRSLLYIRGGLPGPVGSLLKLRDSHKIIDRQYLDLLYPTYIKPEDEEYPEILMYDGGELDPLEQYDHDNSGLAGKEDEEE